jgi:aryl-alcohol dehydrogenase-like predicted oxidoreductase
LKLVDQITELADKKGVKANQLTLAWLMAQGDNIFPIPGTTNVNRFKGNLCSLDVKLGKEEQQHIRKAFEDGDVIGDRYDPQFMAHCYADTPALN